MRRPRRRYHDHQPQPGQPRRARPAGGGTGRAAAPASGVAVEAARDCRLYCAAGSPRGRLPLTRARAGQVSGRVLRINGLRRPRVVINQGRKRPTSSGANTPEEGQGQEPVERPGLARGSGRGLFRTRRRPAWHIRRRRSAPSTPNRRPSTSARLAFIPRAVHHGRLRWVSPRGFRRRDGGRARRRREMRNEPKLSRGKPRGRGSISGFVSP